MVERVEQAIAVGIADRLSLRDVARAAIEAMMEDIDGSMWVAGRDEFIKQADRFAAPDRHEIAMAIADRAPERIFEAMLRSSLKEPTP